MIDRAEFTSKFVSELASETACLFVGAGLSAGCGHMDWRDIMRPFAEDLCLDINREDPITVAQWWVNKRGSRSRGGLIDHLMRHFPRRAPLSQCHKLIAKLPVRTIWTTNYDNMLEEAFRSVNRTYEVKKRDSSFTYRYPHADVTINKMHGDIDSNPEDIVITEDDYEQYDNKYFVMANMLYTSLAQNTFLFLGFSFRDPNLRRILGRIRLHFQSGSREHYAILRKPGDGGIDDIRFEHFTRDLQRYNIQTVAVQDYEEVSCILRELYNNYLKTVGSEDLYGQDQRNKFIIERLQFLCDNPKPGLKIYNYAVFSIFAASGSPAYREHEPELDKTNHMAQILRERLLSRLVSSEHTELKLMLWPPPPDPGHAIRYRTLIDWLQSEGNRPNIQVRCSSYYRGNCLIIPGEFAIQATYVPKEGWSKNVVYYNKDDVERLVQEFEDTFESRTHYKTTEDVLTFLESQAQLSENAKLNK